MINNSKILPIASRPNLSLNALQPTMGSLAFIIGTEATVTDAGPAYRSGSYRDAVLHIPSGVVARKSK